MKLTHTQTVCRCHQLLENAEAVVATLGAWAHVRNLTADERLNLAIFGGQGGRPLRSTELRKQFLRIRGELREAIVVNANMLKDPELEWVKSELERAATLTLTYSVTPAELKQRCLEHLHGMLQFHKEVYQPR